MMYFYLTLGSGAVYQIYFDIDGEFNIKFSNKVIKQRSEYNFILGCSQAFISSLTYFHHLAHTKYAKPNRRFVTKALTYCASLEKNHDVKIFYLQVKNDAMAAWPRLYKSTLVEFITPIHGENGPGYLNLVVLKNPARKDPIE